MEVVSDTVNLVNAISLTVENILAKSQLLTNSSVDSHLHYITVFA